MEASFVFHRATTVSNLLNFTFLNLGGGGFSIETPTKIVKSFFVFISNVAYFAVILGVI